MGMETSRRAILGAAIAGSAAVALPLPAHAADWRERWSPTAAADGMGAWETVADDRANSHPAGQPHIYPEGDNWRFNMHTVDRDTKPDRQRNEVIGGHLADGTLLRWRPGETWRVTYSMYLPGSLQATNRFTHIMQIKTSEDAYPVVAQSLQLVDGAQTIRVSSPMSNVMVGSTSLDPLHDTWTDVDLHVKVGRGRSGAVRWILNSGGRTVVDVAKDGINTLPSGTHITPRWGIYRSVMDDSSNSLVDCFMLMTNLHVYQQA
jgi:hypothetical protein